MTWIELRKQALREYYPALFLERIVHHRTRKKIYEIIRLITILLFLVSLVLFGITHAPEGGVNTSINFIAFKIYGLFLISLAVWIIAGAIQAFYYSYYFKGLDDTNAATMSFELAHVLYRSNPKDLLSGFVRTREGRFVLMRTGIHPSEFKQYFASGRQMIPADQIVFTDTNKKSFKEYAEKLFDADKNFAQLLFAQGIQKNDFLAVCDWVTEREVAEKQRERWWTKNNLARIPGLGKDWSFGQTPGVDAFSMSLPTVSKKTYFDHAVMRVAEAVELESNLIKKQKGNVILIGDSLEQKLTIVARLQTMIEEGTAYPDKKA